MTHADLCRQEKTRPADLCKICKKAWPCAAKEERNEMDAETKQAFDWAINQEFQSVAARNARILAKYIVMQKEKK